MGGLPFKVHESCRENQITFKSQPGNLMNEEARFKKAGNNMDSEVYVLCIKDLDLKSFKITVPSCS